jgi:NAD(P)-dependent dehydrogenase (short-subunit alcohol dehydrogenase family)
MSQNQFDIAGKVAIVTGSTGGLGTDIVRVLHRCGARVVIAGRSVEAGRAIEAELGEGALFVPTDVSKDADIDRCIDAAVNTFGKLDILVNNACVYTDPGIDATREQWLESLNVNLVSGAIFVQKAVPHMRKQGGGTIINLSSVSAKFGRVGTLVYPAAKAAILGVTKNEAVSLAPDNIRVLAITPAWTWSPSIEKLAGTIEAADAIGKRFHPVGRIGRGEEVGWTVVFACSPAASFLTGADIPVDGGYSLLGPDQGKNPRAWLAES